ncbi:MAG: hypothetical protein ACOH2N_15580 [Devosia sp.]
MDKLDLLMAARNSPWFFAWRWKQLEDPKLHRRVVRRGDDAVIEGYPRSANTFATYAFEQAQERSLKLGNHFHSPAQFLLAAKYGVPAMLVIREPVGAALSFMVFSDNMSAREALRRYIAFHEPLLSIQSHFVVAPFEEIIVDFDASIARLNARFGTQFKLFNHTKQRADALLQRIDRERDAKAKDHPDLLDNALKKSVPSIEKDRARSTRVAELAASDIASLRQRAQDIFDALVGASPASAHRSANDRPL